MPLYPYRCARCGHEFEEIQKFSDRPIQSCPSCGEFGVVEKQITSGSFVLKGGGWYQDGYAKKKETVTTKTKDKLIKEKS